MPSYQVSFTIGGLLPPWTLVVEAADDDAIAAAVGAVIARTAGPAAAIEIYGFEDLGSGRTVELVPAWYTALRNGRILP